MEQSVELHKHQQSETSIFNTVAFGEGKYRRMTLTGSTLAIRWALLSHR